MLNVSAERRARRLGEKARAMLAMSGLFLLVYYGLGAMYPLLTQYYRSIGLTGTQIGTISSIPPIVAILAQPLWGVICDRYGVRKGVLILALAVSAGLALLFPLVRSYAAVLVLFTALSLFQCAVGPVSDSLALSLVKRQNIPYGNVRLWGAVGFAVAVFFTGLAVNAWGTTAIFVCYSAAFVAAVALVRTVADEPEGGALPSGIASGLGQLIRLPRFLLFVASAFFIFGAMNANNTWFALYYQHIGGSVTGIGLAFLLFAGSEAPCMRLVTYVVRRWGFELTILLAGAVSALRWFWYSTAPGTTAVLALFFLQGLSVGCYLGTAAQYVRETTPSSLQVTALTIFASVGQGLGTMTCNLLAGVIMDWAGILATYRFFGVVTLVGLVPLLILRYVLPKREQPDRAG